MSTNLEIKSIILAPGIEGIEKKLKKNDIILVEANEYHYGPIHVARVGFYQGCRKNYDIYGNGFKCDALYYKPAIDKSGKNISFPIRIKEIKEIKVLGNIEDFFEVELKK